MLTASGAAAHKTGVTPLAEKLVITKDECDKIKSLLEKRDYYSNLLAICENLLNLESYAYIVEQNLNIDKYEHKGKFPVRTNRGKELVKLPNKLTHEEMNEFYEQYKSIENEVYGTASNSGQAIVDRQIKCDSKSSESAKCIKKLNCLKVQMMSSEHPGELYVLYKGVKVKLDAPPSDWSDPCKEEPGKLDSLKDNAFKLGKNIVGITTDNILGGVAGDGFASSALKTLSNGILGGDMGNGLASSAVKTLSNDIVSGDTGKDLASSAVKNLSNDIVGGDTGNSLASSALKTLSDGILGGDTGGGDNLATSTVKTLSQTILGPDVSNALSSFIKSIFGKKTNNGGQNGSAGEEFSQDAAVKLMTFMAPNLGGYLASSLTSNGAPTILNKDHIKILKTYIANKFRKEQNKKPLSKSGLKRAVEASIKTFLHLALMSQKLKLMNHTKHLHPFIQTLQVAAFDALASETVNFIVNRFMEEDEKVDKKDGKGKPPKKKGRPVKEYTSSELINDEEDNI